MRKTIISLSVLAFAACIPLCSLADMPSMLDRIIRGKTVNPGKTDKKTTVPKRSKDPVNIPISTERFRPTTEGNSADDIFCFYWMRRIVINTTSGNGEVRILIKTPDNPGGRLYRLASGSPLEFPVSGETGDYSVEVKTSRGLWCTFEFEIVD